MAAYTTGEFCWYELGTRDIAAAVKFYKDLAHWGTLTQAMGEQGAYYVFQVEGKDVGGGYQMSGPQFEGIPPHWMPYVWVDDVDAAVTSATRSGGNVIAQAMDVPNVGRMAFLQDPQGAHFAVYMGREHQGAARLSAKPGTFCWTELMTTSAADARNFYGEIFGWTHAEMPMADGGTYTIFQVNGKPAAGMMQMDGPQFQGIPPNWLSYLSVSDCDAEVARAAEMGAKVLTPPQDVPNTGRFSVLQDPTGTVFAIIALVPMK